MPNRNSQNKNHSIKAQLMCVMLGLVIFVFVLVLVTLYGFLGRFYQKEKTDALVSVYDGLNEAGGGNDFPNEIIQATAEGNIQVLITDPNFTPLRSTSADPRYLSTRLFGYYTGLFQENFKTLKQTKTYRVQISDEERLGLNYLEMWGQLDNGDWFLLRTPIDSLTETVHQTSQFLLIVFALGIIAAMALIVIISERFTKPLTELTVLSQRMSRLDFGARYRGHVKNEIQVLGENFNSMSDELQKTIGNLKSANNALRQDNEQKTRIDEMRKEFLNNVSHELKTPIALIQGYAEGLRDDVADDEESRQYYCDVIVDEAGKMNKLVRQLLTLNQLEFGQDSVKLSRFDLTALITGVIGKMSLMAEEKGVTVTFPHRDDVWAWGDDFKIEEVVVNLLSNAIHHADYEKKIEISLTRQEGRVKVTVFNSGDPIPEADLDRIWEKFYKVDKARTRAYGGSGIGLSIVKAIIEGHGQHCGVRNYDNGVAFWFTLEEQNTM